MKMTFSKVVGKVEITIIKVAGNLDASTHDELMAQVEKMREMDMQYLLLDLSETEFISSAGVVALHSIARTMRGDTPTSTENGWGALDAMKRTQVISKSKQRFVKLLNPSQRVMVMLKTVGFDQYFDIFNDLDTAIAAFG